MAPDRAARTMTVRGLIRRRVAAACGFTLLGAAGEHGVRAQTSAPVVYVIGLLIPIVVLLSVVLYLVPVPLWIAAWSSGAYVGLLTLVDMRLRRVPPSTIVTARMSAVKAGLQGASVNDLEAHYLAGGNVVRVVNALISADKANIEMPFKRAAAIDSANREGADNFASTAFAHRTRRTRRLFPRSFLERWSRAVCSYPCGSADDRRPERARSGEVDVEGRHCRFDAAVASGAQYAGGIPAEDTPGAGRPVLRRLFPFCAHAADVGRR